MKRLVERGPFQNKNRVRAFYLPFGISICDYYAKYREPRENIVFLLVEQISIWNGAINRSD